MIRAILVATIALLAMSCDRNITIQTPTQPTPPPVTTPTPPAQPPVVSYFAPDSSRLAFGTQTLLHWEVDDATARVRVDPYPGDVPPNGATIVTATNTGPMFFVLTAKNSGGSTQRFVTIQVF